MMSMGSKPAFSASVKGISSTASANASTASCSRPPTFTAKARRFLANSASGAPPPATILPSSIALRTTHKPSCKAAFCFVYDVFGCSSDNDCYCFGVLAVADVD